MRAEENEGSVKSWKSEEESASKRKEWSAMKCYQSEKMKAEHSPWTLQWMPGGLKESRVVGMVEVKS